jgi:hypothetical protein
MSENTRGKKFYVQNGEFQKICIADDLELAAQKVLIEIIQADSHPFAPFMIISERGFHKDIVAYGDDIDDESQIMLVHAVARSIAEDVVDVELVGAVKFWTEIAEKAEKMTIDFNDSAGYQAMLADLA